VNGKPGTKQRVAGSNASLELQAKTPNQRQGSKPGAHRHRQSALREFRRRRLRTAPARQPVQADHAFFVEGDGGQNDSFLFRIVSDHAPKDTGQAGRLQDTRPTSPATRPSHVDAYVDQRFDPALHALRVASSNGPVGLERLQSGQLRWR
jgi:hypothetical protein